MKFLVVLCGLAIGLISMPITSAQASEEPRDESEWLVPMGLTVAALTVPLGVNTYSTFSKSPVAPLWHWAGYGIGGLSFVLGTVGLWDNLGKDDTTKTWLASGLMGYGLCHMTAAYIASDIKPESNTGVLAPMVAVGEQGERQLGLTWMARF